MVMWSLLSSLDAFDDEWEDLKGEDVIATSGANLFINGIHLKGLFLLGVLFKWEINSFWIFIL